jgi:hypothetical protein
MNQPSLFVLRSIFPSELISYIDQFIPFRKKIKKTTSPSLQKELYKIQNMKLKGVSNMYMKDLYEFLLD